MKRFLYTLCLILIVMPPVLSFHSISPAAELDNGILIQSNDNFQPAEFYWETVQLTDNDLNEESPRIDNDMIVWQAYDGNDYEIFFWNGTSHQLTDNGYDDNDPQIDNGMVTWRAAVNGSYPIYLWNGTVHELANDSYFETKPQIDDGLVVWNDYCEVYLWNGTVNQLTNHSGLGSSYTPQICAGEVVWTYYNGTETDVYLWNGTLCKLTNTVYNEYHPQIDGGSIVWYGNNEVFFWNGTTYQLTNSPGYGDEDPQIDDDKVTWAAGRGDYGALEIDYWNGTRFEITSNSRNNQDPQIDNGIIVWYGWDSSSDPNDYEIYLWNGEVKQITNNEQHDRYPQIDNEMVVWCGWDGHDNEIFILVQDTTPPTIDHPDDVFYEESTTGHLLMWLPHDNHPSEYEIRLDGVLFDSGPWTGDNISINIDGLSVGLHEFVCIIYDGPGLMCNDSVLVQVFSRYPVWLFEPTDQIISFNQHFDYQLAVIDASGIGDWWINNTEDFQINATYYNDVSTVRITNNSMLDWGSYGISLTVTDLCGNSLSATFSIVVNEGTPPEWDEEYSEQHVEYGQEADFVVSATDPSGIHEYWVDDEVRFTVDWTGRVRSVNTLPVGEYGLTVYVDDLYGNTNLAQLVIIVEDTTAPEWAVQPSNQEIVCGDAFSYQLQAADLSEVFWEVNNTADFAIRDGLITNLSVLEIGSYNLEVSVSDQYGNTLSCNLQIVVVADETEPSSLSPIMWLFIPAIGIGALIIAGIAFRRRG